MYNSAELDTEFDDYVRCNNCDFVGFVRLGADDCPKCNGPCLSDEPKHPLNSGIEH